VKWRAFRRVHPNKKKTVCFPRPPHLKRHPFRSLCRRYIRDRSLQTQIAPSPRQRITTTFIKGSVARSLSLLPAPLSLHTINGQRVGTLFTFRSDLLLFPAHVPCCIRLHIPLKTKISANGSASSRYQFLIFSFSVRDFCLGISIRFTTWRWSWRLSGTRRSSTYTPFVYAPRLKSAMTDYLLVNAN